MLALLCRTVGQEKLEQDMKGTKAGSGWNPLLVSPAVFPGNQRSVLLLLPLLAGSRQWDVWGEMSPQSECQLKNRSGCACLRCEGQGIQCI